MQYTVRASIRQEEDSIELFERDFEAVNSEGEATRRTCEIVLERVLEGDNWSLENIFLMTDRGMVKLEWFDMNVALNFCIKQIRKKASSAAVPSVVEG